MSTVDSKMFDNIRNNYPKTFEWMQGKASREHISVGAVMNNYMDHIEKLMNKELT